MPLVGRALAIVSISPESATPAGLRRLLLATTNPHKIEELRAILAGLPYELVSPNDIGLALQVEETGTTFAENAILKATAWADAADMLTLAEDSGLEIDALGGEPGIYSARWAGEDVSYEERFRILLRQLADVPAERRTARYHAAMAIARAAPVGVLGVFEGTLEGQIAFAPAGRFWLRSHLLRARAAVHRRSDERRGQASDQPPGAGCRSGARIAATTGESARRWRAATRRTKQLRQLTGTRERHRPAPTGRLGMERREGCALSQCASPLTWKQPGCITSRMSSSRSARSNSPEAR
jgi:XTP/dITP diphosphohydrolase